VSKVLATNGIKLERAIGVIYRPKTERLSHYYFCDVGNQFDLMCFSGTTSAVVPIDEEVTPEVDTLEPETYPSGF
jgi:erythromycin esterase-like protein